MFRGCSPSCWVGSATPGRSSESHKLWPGLCLRQRPWTLLLCQLGFMRWVSIDQVSLEASQVSEASHADGSSRSEQRVLPGPAVRVYHSERCPIPPMMNQSSEREKN